MKTRSWLRTIWHIDSLLALIVAVVAAGFGSTAQAAKWQAVHAEQPWLAANLEPINSLPETNQLNLAIALPLRNQSALSNLLQQIYDPASPNFHHYLTPAEFTAQFGPSTSDYQAVIAFAKANGFSVNATHSNRLLLDVSGPVPVVEKALHVKMHTFHHPTENRTFYAPDEEPTIDLSVPILRISGLDDFSVPHPRLAVKSLDEAPSATPNAGSGPSGTYMGNDFRAAYVPDTTMTGSGQIVGLLQFDGYTSNDISYYEQRNSLPAVTLTNVLLDGFTGQPTRDGGEVEVSLDIEMSISMAPGLSKIIVYEAGPYGNWHDILNRMATDDLAKQLSCSWYIPNGASDPVADGIWQEMAAQGQSFLNASGDDDAYSGLIAFPGDSPYITQVGGTTLGTTGPGGSWTSETVWNWGNSIGSGGGISTQYPIPSWQTNVSMAANQGSTTLRNTPDVALTADNVYVRADGFDYNVGGTSCAAPLWAAFTALVNQEATSSGHSTVGFLNPLVYAIGTKAAYSTDFHDITTGNNESPSSPNKFSAVTGYDLCTGWGTPAGQKLIDALANPEPLIIIPSAGFSSIGGVGGPFMVAYQVFSLTNSGTNSLSWSLVNTSSWLNVSSTGGTLAAAGPSTNVVVSLNTVASNLSAGIYTATIAFTNLNDLFGQARQFTLDIITPPAITLQPTNEAVLDGENATFSAQTSGGVPQYYQWQFDGTNLTDGAGISGSLTTNLTVTAASMANAGTYTLIVSNAADVITSSNAILSLIPSPPVITVQPANETVGVNSTAQFSVAAIGTKPISYQWSFYGTNIVDATNATLALPDVQFTNAGNYSVALTNLYGSTNSAAAVLTVTPCDPTPSGIVSWWPGEGNMYDQVSGNNGTVVGSVAYGPGEVGQSFVFNGNGSGVLVTGNPSNLQLQNFTIENWIQRASLSTSSFGSGGNGVIFSYGPGGYILFLNTYGQLVFGQLGNVSTVNGPSITDTNWHHVALTMTNGTVTFYLDGVASAPSTYNVTFTFTGDPAIGIRPDNDDNSFYGSIDELSVYNRALSPAEIQAIYIAGSSGKCFSPTPPSIVTQPTNETVYADNSATFQVVATGTQPLEYQWNFDSTNIPGATNALLTLTNVQPVNAGIYAVTVSNSAGSILSSNASLTVLTLPPSILTQPANQTNFLGTTATFSVAAGGTQPLDYQWSFGSTNISGATSPTLTLTNVQFNQAGNYSVTITNLYGSTNSMIATLTVNPPPPCDPEPSGIVSWWPGEGNMYDQVSGNNGTVVGSVAYGPGEVGQSFVFNGNGSGVLVTGNPSNLQLQNFTIENWIQRASLSTSSFGSGGNGVIFSYGPGGYILFLNTYGQLVFGQLGNVSTVNGPSITDTNWHHVALTMTNGTVTFYLDGVASAPSTYNVTFTFTGDPAIGIRPDNDDNSFYGSIDELSVYNRALASNEIAAIYSAGIDGKCFTPTAPTITTQPTNMTVFAGQTAAFSVSAAGTPTLSYQWAFDTTNIPGATNATLTLPGVVFTNAGTYSVAVTNIAGSVLSSNAVLTVSPLPLCDPDPSGIVSWWAGEGNIFDQISAYNGTIVSNVNYTTGKVGQCFVFDGRGSGVQITNNSPNLHLQNFTIENWMKRTSTTTSSFGSGGNGVIFSYGTGGYILFLNNNGLLVFAQLGNASTVNGPSITDTNWHHVALTMTNGTVKFYLDGVVSAPSTYNVTFTFSGGPAIGFRPDNKDNSFYGAIDEMSIYNRALASNEIAAIYNAGSGGKCFNPTPPVITRQPTNQTVNLGQTIGFSIVATNVFPLTYQWTINNTNIPGATNTSLTLTNVQFTNAGNYVVAVSTPFISTNSSNALLSVEDILNSFTWAPIPSPQFVNMPFGVTIQAIGTTNEVLTNFSGTVFLKSTNGVPIIPTVTPNFMQGVWTGNVTLAQPVNNLVLLATNSTGPIGLANAITVFNEPALGYAVSGSYLLMSWPVVPTNFTLESSSTLSPPQWTPVSIPPLQIGDEYLESIEVSNTNQYYRLQLNGN